MNEPYTTPTDRTPAYACGFAGGLVESALRRLRDMPKPYDDIAALKLRWAISDLEVALVALKAPFDVAREGGAA
jgi:hypothetical protein